MRTTVLFLDAPKRNHMTTKSADIAATPLRELAAALRGDLIVPGDPHPPTESTHKPGRT
jgi:hypothetical protein